MKQLINIEMPCQIGKASMETRQLFGGAIDVQLPSRFQDVSEFRPVPDNQEASFRCDSST